MYVVKVHLKANTDDNPNVEYFIHDEPRSLYSKYYQEKKILILQDVLGDGEREIWFGYPDKETRDQIKDQMQAFPESYHKDVTVTILSEG